MANVIDKTGKGRHAEASPPVFKKTEEIMKIRMKSTQKSGAPDGIVVKEFQKGKTYDLPPEDAQRFIEKDWAKPVGKVEPEETKTIEPEETKEEEETEEAPAPAERHKK